MTRVSSKLSQYGAFGLLCFALGACSQARNDTAQELSAPEVGSLESALEDSVAQCQEQQVTCLGAASDLAAAAQCNTAFRECLGGVADNGQQLAEALVQCREKAAECAVQGGVSGAEACRDEYEACVSAASSDGSQTPEADAGAPEEPQQPSAAGDSAPPSAGAPSTPGIPGRSGRLPFPGAGGAGGLGGLPTGRGLPRFPGAGSISLPTGPDLPGRLGSAASACFEALRACVEAPNADLDQCATSARACVRSGGPMGAAGTGGSAGAP